MEGSCDYLKYLDGDFDMMEGSIVRNHGNIIAIIEMTLTSFVEKIFNQEGDVLLNSISCHEG